MWIQATQLRSGMLISYEGELHRIMSVEHFAMATQAGIIKAKLRNLRTGTQGERRINPREKVERVTLDQRIMEFLYQSGDEYYFMDTETYEQIPLTEDILGTIVSYLVPNLRLEIEFFEEQTPIAVTPPKTVDLKVTDTAPALKGATVTNQLKPAETETGLVVNVPAFVSPGDVIRVETETGNYLSRAK